MNLLRQAHIQCHVMTSPHAGITGPVCDEVCEPAGQVVQYINKIMVTYACVSGALLQINNVVSTVSSFTLIGPFVVEFLQHFGWTRVGIVTASDNVWQSTTTYLQVDGLE
jgi:hypothetical protein